LLHGSGLDLAVGAAIALNVIKEEIGILRKARAAQAA
jgi:hypothetical protein